uniref:Uncharacterized protein n=2 Tax=Anthurium amnicola TaxID=1678845 RepID=A0A1D1ZED8_9ARAE
MFQPLHGIPNYVDEFKYGFPVDGLSLSTPQWWGSCSSGSTGKSLQSEFPCEDEEPHTEKSSLNSPDKAREPGNKSKPVSLLCSVRKRAVVDGEESIKLGISRGYGRYRLGTNERSILIQIFKSSLPRQWK